MEITTQELKDKISNGETLLIDFYGTFCGPCKVLKPMFESASKSLSEANSTTSLYTFNIEQDKEYVVNGLGIRSVPTLKGFSGGKEVYHNVGVIRTEQIIEVANNLGA
jgi:thioredoxin-like negative regulator of GroEL